MNIRIMNQQEEYCHEKISSGSNRIIAYHPRRLRPRERHCRADEIDTTVGKSDQDAAYDESSATKITLTGASASISGNGASQKDGVVTIQQEGTYLVSGTLENGQLVVDAADTEKVQIVLQNVSIDCSDHAALFIKQADKVFLTLAEGTENTLSSGSSYALGDDDSNVDGVIFS